MSVPPDIVCIGSVLWDRIGRTDRPMAAGDDQPGRIARLPGGVALNIARTLARLGARPALLSVIGADPQGAALRDACADMGLVTEYLSVDAALPTDQYIAIEARGRLVAAIADTRSLEVAGARILSPLKDGRLGGPGAPWTGPIALDGNLPDALLASIARDPDLAGADLRIASASPGKAGRLRSFLGHPGATFYVNRAEAGRIADARFPDAATAAAAMVAAGAARVLVTDGAAAAVDAGRGAELACRPPAIRPGRITGAGDAFMAGHVAAELAGLDRAAALHRAVDAAVAHVAG